jgi:hypothetical protein
MLNCIKKAWPGAAGTSMPTRVYIPEAAVAGRLIMWENAQIASESHV